VLLTSGISGYSLEHSDIGGYTAIDNPVLRYHRSKELLLRWIELGAELMVAPVLDPDTDTVEVYLPAGIWVHLWTG
jgi:alpha-glucosidase (family GH31 glycosyl hydrolase)